MALCKRNNIWWIRFTYQGKRVQKSTGTSDKIAAQQLHDEMKAALWRIDKLQEKPQKTWVDATIRWVEESQHKRTLKQDKACLRWLDKYLKLYLLKDITRDHIEQIAKVKELTGVAPATVNRLLALVRAILRKAEREWERLDKAPMVRLRKEGNHQVRWLTSAEARKLLTALPAHLSDMAAFSLATGLRESNVTGLQWQDVDLVNSHAWVHPDQAKARKAIAAPLNSGAMQILQKQIGQQEAFVFTFQGNPVKQCNTKAWRKALQKAGITQFRLHYLFHTWASWHVQSGTSLQELQQLGGWASYQMVCGMHI